MSAPSVLVGRTTATAGLDAALADAHSGGGRMALLSGEPGIGKTALADWTAQRATERGMQVLRGAATNDAGAPPLWPWRRAARELPPLAELLTANLDVADQVARFTRKAVAADLLVAAGAADGLLLLLEDLHWADESSLQLLEFVGRELSKSRVLVLATSRPPEPDTQLAAAWPGLLRTSGTGSLVLDQLTVADVAEWLAVRALPGWRSSAADVHARTGGNPLFLRLVVDALPPGAGSVDALDDVVRDNSELRDLVLDRVDRLPAVSREVLSAAALLGERIRTGVLTEVVGRQVPEVGAALDEAQRAGVLRRGGNSLHFAHALVRDAIAERLPLAVRSDWHARIAQTLAASDTGTPPGVIADHWRRAAGPTALRRALALYRSATAEALEIQAFESAFGFAQRALDCAVELDVAPADRAELVVEMARAQFGLGQPMAALRSCTRAADLAEDAQRPDLVAAAALVVHGIGSIPLAASMRAISRRALRLIDVEDTATRARLLALIAVADSENEIGPPAAARAAEALALAERSGDREALLEALAARHLSITLPETVQERLQLADRAVELGSESGRIIAQLWGHLWRVAAQYQLGQLSAADQECASIEQIAQRHGSAIARWHVLRIEAMRSALTGDFAAGREANQRALDLAAKADDISMVGMSFAFAIQLAITRGDPADCLPGPRK